MVSASVRRQQIAFFCQRGRSVQTSVRAVEGGSFHRWVRVEVGVQRDAPAVTVMKELALQYPRYGYRRIQVFMGRRGHAMSMSIGRTGFGVCIELQVPVKEATAARSKQAGRGLCQRQRRWVMCGPMISYSIACANGQQLKCLTVVDEFTHECLAIDVAGSIRSGRVIEVLSRLVSVHGSPKHLRSDNGPEFVSRRGVEVADRGVQHRHRAH